MTPENEVEEVVLRHLADITKVARSRIRPSDDLVRDLKADSDDLSFLFVPAVERALGVIIPPENWSSVHTVRDAVDLLCAAKAEQH